ncbi:amidohydrolase family protein [Ornithinimicrobium tianjinense]|uniref:Amidohydrolase n=1 Tax=Ornithinimicrobium tianjinense TaxID=1195761 RepID=A0A917FAY4_9MICO|nr:amidohydrolase family protein [Ornithinimicrobium tianjinense]GGF58654.1 amidohydrolase [Ornithinimicrobium tianjinense]
MPDLTTTVPDWLRAVPLVDHHCHGVADVTLDRPTFEDLITESDAPAPTGTTFFDTQLGFAIRRHCAPVLDLPAFATPEDYLARRAELGPAEVNQRLLRATGIGDYVVETGHRSDEILDPAGMGASGAAGYAEVVRLERTAEIVAEELAVAGAPCDFPTAFRARLDDLLDPRLTGAVGVKSIAAYRGGFDIDPSRPTDDEVTRAVAAWLAAAPEGQPLRLTDPVLIRFGWWEAVDRAVPIQLHVGYGDPDVDLHRCNPLLLTDLLRLARGSGASFMLLHCYPFHREAGYLAHVFEHVYCDVGLAVTYTGAQSAQVIAESLELTPFHKALFSSDAFGAAELFHLGAGLFRTGLARALATWGEGWPEDEQLRVAQLVGSENARRVYRLDEVATTTFGRAGA